MEIVNFRKSNIIVGCLYKLPNIDVNDFNQSYLNTLLDKIFKENKQVFLFGDFNINLLNSGLPTKGGPGGLWRPLFFV